MILYRLVFKYDAFDNGKVIQYSFDFDELNKIAKYLNDELENNGWHGEYFVEEVNSKYVYK